MDDATLSGCVILRGDAIRLPLPDRSVSLVCGSPPYEDARLYMEGGRDLGISRGCREWVDWMLIVTAEALRVCDGPVIWVAAGVTRDRNYHPACEGLAYRWWSEGWGERGPGSYTEGSMYRPVFWNRVGVPGSGHDDWFRHDVEFCLCFKRPGPLPWADNTACGHPPKWAPGGEMSHRVADGDRRNQWGKHLGSRTSSRNRYGTFQAGYRPSHRPQTMRDADGQPRRQDYVPPALANPGNLIRTAANGGGRLGHPAAHENEAPYPVDVPEFFVKSLCPPGGIVLDPFSGSGTTCEASLKHGRRAIGLDLRASQCRVAARRIGRPHAPVRRASRGESPAPLFDGIDAES